jgi:hypothetical protein
LSLRILAASVLFAILSCQATLAQGNDTRKDKDDAPLLERTLSWLERHFHADFSYGYSTMDKSGDAPVAKHFQLDIKREPLRFDTCAISWQEESDTISLSLSNLDSNTLPVTLFAKPDSKSDTEIWELTLSDKDKRKTIRVESPNSGARTQNQISLKYDTRGLADKFALGFQHAIKLCQAKPVA